MSKLTVAFVAFAAPLLAVLAGAPKAGPPFVTDDPEPTAYGHFEIYLYTDGVAERDGFEAAAPALEINYGALPDLQVSAALPLDVAVPKGTPARVRIAGAELGVKYRFVEEDEDGWRPQVSVYPSFQTALGRSGIRMCDTE